LIPITASHATTPPTCGRPFRDVQPFIRRRRGVRVVPLIGLALAGWSGAGELFVICNAAVGLQPAEIRDTFVGEKGFVGVVKLAPADNSAVQAAFLERVLKVNAAKYAGIWTKKSFRDGDIPPPIKASDAEALAYVKQTQGGCSYVGTEPGPDVKVIARY
jgi:hypothetical protein